MLVKHSKEESRDLKIGLTFSLAIAITNPLVLLSQQIHLASSLVPLLVQYAAHSSQQYANLSLLLHLTNHLQLFQSLKQHLTTTDS
mgnify:CR=1 FL=1